MNFRAHTLILSILAFTATLTAHAALTPDDLPPSIGPGFGTPTPIDFDEALNGLFGPPPLGNLNGGDFEFSLPAYHNPESTLIHDLTQEFVLVDDLGNTHFKMPSFMPMSAPDWQPGAGGSGSSAVIPEPAVLTGLLGTLAILAAVAGRQLRQRTTGARQ